MNIRTDPVVAAGPHRFHTRHDFSPDAAFELYGLIRAMVPQGAILTPAQIKEALNATASPLKQRRDLSKTLMTLADLGLLEVFPRTVRCSHSAGHLLLGKRLWRRKFVAVVHALYALGYRGGAADPGWSYREVCRILTERAPNGISSDEIVMEVVRRAQQKFSVERVSFSRSSVGGVKAWLLALDPPVISVDQGRLIASPETERTPSLVLDVVRAAVALAGGSLVLDGDCLSMLAAALLVPANRVQRLLHTFLEPAVGIFLSDDEPPRLRQAG